MSQITDPKGLFKAEPEVVSCPYPLFDKLRSEQPVYWSESGECFIVTRYEDIVEIATHPEQFKSLMPLGPVVARHQAEITNLLLENNSDISEVIQKRGSSENRVLLHADPPDHVHQRRKVSRIFTPRQISKRESDIRRIANELVDEFVDEGRVEMVEEYGVPLPLTVIADYMNVGQEMMSEFKKWSNDFVAILGKHNMSQEEMVEVISSQNEFFDYIGELIDKRRGGTEEDLVSLVVGAGEDGDNPLSVPEMLGMLNQFLVAGNETTTKMIVTATRLMIQEELEGTLRDSPEMIPTFLEECLRIEAPVQCLYRQAAQDCRLGGVDIPAGSSLMLTYASGNYDEAHFTNPHEFRLDRENPTNHLAFGKGEHFCIGASLARLEGRVAFEVLLERCEEIKLEPSKNTFEYETSYVLHGLKELHCTFLKR